VFATARNLEKTALDDFIGKFRLDVTSQSDVVKVVQKSIDSAGRIDILVNSAGIECAGTS
jgi:1-acylglycerone phosphate reductase